MFPGLTLAYWLTLHGLVTLAAVMIYVVTAHVLQQRRHPTAAIAWVLFILLLPYVALPSFLTFGSRKQARPRVRPLRLAPPAPSDPDDGRAWAVQTALAMGQPAHDRGDRDDRSVAGQDRVRPHVLLDLGKQLLLEAQVL